MLRQLTFGHTIEERIPEHLLIARITQRANSLLKSLLQFLLDDIVMRIGVALVFPLLSELFPLCIQRLPIIFLSPLHIFISMALHDRIRPPEKCFRLSWPSQRGTTPYHMYLLQCQMQYII